MSKQSEGAKGLVQGQTEVGISKFGPFLEHEHISRAIRLPSGYNKDRIVAMVRDPWWIFAYWEITRETEEYVNNEIRRHGKHSVKSILRVYDITAVKGFNGKNANSYFDIVLKDMARNWYIDVGSPGRTWCVEIGIVTEKNDFYVLARSNIVNTPRFGISDILDETWMLSEEEYFRIFGASCGLDVVGKSSLEMKELFQRHLMEWVSSGGITSFASHILGR
jgi:hypothetical protein